MKVIVAIILYIVFWGICYVSTGTDEKNMKGFRSYPDEVQKKVRENKVLGSLAPNKVSIPMIFISNLLTFVVLFSIIGILLKNVLGISDYLSAFLYFLLVGEGLNLFDLVVIDLLWWRNDKRIRFSFIPEKEMYQNPQKHIYAFLRGIPTFAIVAVVVAWIVNLI